MSHTENTPLLEVRNLKKYFGKKDRVLHAVDDISFKIGKGKTMGVVGESGCGKSVLCKSVMKLLPGNARISGKMLIDGNDIAPYTEKQMRKLRGSLFSMLFQDPMTTLNPRHSTSACLRILRASARRPPPTRCAVSTLKPMAAA